MKIDNWSIRLAAILGGVLLLAGSLRAATVDNTVISAQDNSQQDSAGSCAYGGQAYYDMGHALPPEGVMLDGIRFEEVQIPGGATINSAFLQVYADPTSTDINAVTLTVAAESLKVGDIGPPTQTTLNAFGAGANDIGSRHLLGTTTTWTIPAGAWTAGTMYQVDVSPILRYMISNGLWVRGMNVNFVISVSSGTGWRRYVSYSGNPAQRPHLHVDYNAPVRTNIAMGKTATSSSNEGGYPAANAVDGLADTRWGSNWNGDPIKDSAWIYVDLGAQYAIDSVFIDWQNAGALQYRIETSNAASPNDQGWTAVATVANGIASERRGFKLATPSIAEFVRMRGVKRLGTYGYSLYELEVYAATSDIQVTSQPQPVTVLAGAQASFTVAATASGSETITYQWQKSTDGVTWNNVGTGATTYSFTTAAGDNGAKFLCKMTNTTGYTYSSAALLTICTAPGFSTQPTPATQIVTAGNTVTYSVAATGTGGAFTYLWQQSKDGGATWPNATGTGVTSATFISAGLTPADNNSQFRCQVSNGCGNPTVSNAVTVSVCTPPAIAVTGQPVGWAGISGSTASFSVGLTPGFSTPVTYQWQRGGPGAWAPVPAGNGSGTSATYTFTALATDNGAQFQCLVTGACGTPVATSSTAIASVCSPPGSTMVSPLSQTVTAGQNVTFKDSASGGGPYHYQWYNSPNGTTWTVTTAGDTLATLSFAAQASQSGYSFNCQVTNGCGTTPATSAAATLTVCTPPNILVAPSNASINVGDSAMFSVSATGSNLQYKWLRLNGTWAPVTVGTGGTTATYKFLPVPPGDNGAQFRVVVYNACANPATDTLGPVSLAICTPPVITKQPADANVNPGAVTTFSAAATGTNITYQWQRGDSLGLTWTPIPNATAASYVDTPSVSDNGAQFRCSIAGKCGSAVTTRAAKLIVCVPVKVTQQNIGADSVLVGANVRYSMAAQGTALKFQWIKSSGGGAFAPIPGDTADSISFSAAKTDSGTTFRCIVSGQCGGPDTGNPGLVRVFTPVHAVFGASVTAGLKPLAVTFTDSSTGDFVKRVWNFGDKTADSAKSVLHTFSDTGNYTVRLTVTGPGGTDSTSKNIFVYPLGADPIQLTGSYVSPTKVYVTLSNFLSITPPSPLVGLDSVGIWYKTGSLPQTPAQSSYLRSYLLATLKSHGTSAYSDTLPVPALTGSDSVYGLMNGIFWSDGSKSTFSAGNGGLVLMKDTLPITNNLRISGQYAPDDTAMVYLDNVNKLDTTRVDSVLVWYSLTGAATPDFTDKNFTLRLNARSVARTGTGDTFPIVNPLFNNEQRTFTTAVVLVGHNGRYSDIKTTSFVVGKKRPANPILLRASAPFSNTVKLSWNSLAGLGVERIKIWYRAGSPIPLQYDLSTLKLDSLVPSVADTAIASANFTGNTTYYFGAQVYANGQWSYITDSSSTSVLTPNDGAPLPANNTAITSLVFDSSSNQIKVCWTSDSSLLASGDSLPQIGIVYSTDSFPAAAGGNAQVVDDTGKTGCAYVKLRENLVFNQTYFVSLWLRAYGRAWTAPGAPGKDSVHVPLYKWQNVMLFSKDYDTVYAFNNQLRFTNLPGDGSRVSNIVRADSVTPYGFLPVSIAFEFQTKDAGVPFNVGLKVSSVPAGYTYTAIRIFRLTASGLWIVDTTALAVDSAHGYVSEVTNNLVYPFMAGVDTRKPSALTLTNVSDSVPSGVAIVDSFRLSDNIANLKWRFESSRGGESFQTGDTTQSGRLTDTSQTVSVTIPSGVVSSDNGVRALLIVTDGTYIDTVDVSRRVISGSSDLVSTASEQWVPMSSTVVLDTQAAAQVLLPLAGTAWKYDETRFRIFRWYASAANSARDDKWVEYADTAKQMFDFARGTLVWVKTKVRTSVRFGRGVTPSLTQPFIVTLPSKQFVDLALPFKFDIRVVDILGATRDSMAASDSLKADSILIYGWKQDATGKYGLNKLYDNTMISLQYNNAAQPLGGTEPTGFSFYNDCDTAVRLVIPPVPQSMSTRLAKKAASRQGWSLTVTTALGDGSSVSSVNCGFTKVNLAAMTFHPMAPSFGEASVGVFDRTTKRVFGDAIAHSQDGGGCSFLLAFCNDAQGKQTFTYHIRNLPLLPKGVQAAVFNDVTGAFEDMSKDSLAVAVGGNSKSYRWLLVGPKDYLAKEAALLKPAVLKLFGTYPNPFASMVHIRYGLPYDGIERLRFVIYDVRGKIVWQTEIKNVARYGVNELTWNGRSVDGRPVAAGVYILRMAATGPGLKQPAVFEKKMTYMP
jgi:PKD repeat protein